MPHPPFHNQIAIVTGASSGIGRATALALARRGAHVALGARREELLKEVARQVEALGREALVVPTDVTHQEAVERLVEETLAQWGRVDILVANAGDYIRCPVVELTADVMRRAMDINFFGSLYAVLAVLPHMRAQKRGHIVLVSSMDGKKGLPPDAPYVTAKFALNGFGEVLRQEMKGYGVHVTTVLPGRVDTAMIGYLKVPQISAKISPEVVAEAILHGIRRRSPEVIVPFKARLLYYLTVLSPRLADWAVHQLHLEGWDSSS